MFVTIAAIHLNVYALVTAWLRSAPESCEDSGTLRIQRVNSSMAMKTLSIDPAN
jgi:hypothetical protein